MTTAEQHAVTPAHTYSHTQKARKPRSGTLAFAMVEVLAAYSHTIRAT